MQARSVILLSVIMTLVACASAPGEPSELLMARDTVQRMKSEPLAGQFEKEAKRAESELATAERLFAQRRDMDVITHRAHLATQYARLVLTQADSARVQKEVEAADEKRQALLLEAREREAEQAQERAELNREAAQASQAEAEEAKALAKRQSMRADQAERRAAELATALEELQAKETDRGTVLTLTDVLFESNESTLKPGAEKSLDALATYLGNDDSNSFLIEGHTDSQGEAEYNKALSAARASSVRDAMVQRGIDSSRIKAVGLGEAYPVAANSTEAGRQQNRRVEIVVAPE